MITLQIESRAGETGEIRVSPTGSLMEAIRDNGFDELLASCGGCCSCATCHVIVDAGFSAVLTPISRDEDSLLDGSDHREETSRLACQIPLSHALDGLKLRIAPMD
jgi:2Fe-2S ferredoxin